MDSGNSSSMQSSSGDDEEYESRTESVPVFFNINPLSNPNPSLVWHHQNHPPTFFDPSANYLNPFSQSQPNNSLLNFDGVEELSQRSEPNSIVEFGNLQGSSSMQSRPSHDNSTVRPLTKPDQKSVVKNPNKRTRASRTAPTTILTTDTMNFRAIVQEFTGIPAPPFSGRLDLLGSGSGMRSSLYPPLRPSAKRVKPITPFASSSSPPLLNNPLADHADINTNTTSNNTIPTSYNYVQQPQNMLNLQKQIPILSFQPFLQSPPLHPCLNLPGFAVNSHGSSTLPPIDELGLSHGDTTSSVGVNDGNEDHLRPRD